MNELMANGSFRNSEKIPFMPTEQLMYLPVCLPVLTSFAHGELLEGSRNLLFAQLVVFFAAPYLRQIVRFNVTHFHGCVQVNTTRIDLSMRVDPHIHPGVFAGILISS